MRAKRFAIVAAAVAAVAAVGAVVALAAGGGGSWNAGWGMMGGRYVYRPAQPTQVHTLRRRALGRAAVREPVRAAGR